MAEVASQVMLELHLNPNRLGAQLAGLGASAPAMPAQSHCPGRPGAVEWH